MRDQERQILEYRPRIEWQIDLLSLVASSGVTPGQVATYQMPPQIQAAIDNPAVGVIDKATQLIDQVDQMTKDLSDCLSGSTTPHGITFDQYEDALKRRDWTVIDKFENFHSDHLYGKMQAEVYSSLRDIQSEFNSYRDFLNGVFLNGQAEYDSLESAVKLEQMDLEDVIAKDIKDPGSQDLTALAVKASICRAASDRIDNAAQMVNNLQAVLTIAPQDHFAGRVDELINSLAEVPTETLQEMVKLNELGFVKAAQEVKDLRQKMKRLGDPSMRLQMDQTLGALAKVKVETNQKVLEWIKGQDLNDESLPVVRFLNDVVGTMQEVEDAYDKNIVDLYKFNRLDKLQNEEFTQKLKAKKKARQLYWLTKNMVDNFNFSDGNRERQIQRFIQNYDLDTPTDICSGDGAPAMLPPILEVTAFNPITGGVVTEPGNPSTEPTTPTSPGTPSTGSNGNVELGENMVESVHIKDGTIMNVDINADAKIDASKINTKDAQNLVSKIEADPGLLVSNEGTGDVVVSIDEEYLLDSLDGRYYTKDELGSTRTTDSGASRIGVKPIPGLGVAETDVQTALERIRNMIDIKARKFTADIGDNTTTEFLLQHDFSTMDLAITVRENVEPYEVVLPDIYMQNENAVRLVFGDAPTTNQYRVTVIG